MNQQQFVNAMTNLAVSRSKSLLEGQIEVYHNVLFGEKSNKALHRFIGAAIEYLMMQETEWVPTAGQIAARAKIEFKDNEQNRLMLPEPEVDREAGLKFFQSAEYKALMRKVSI